MTRRHAVSNSPDGLPVVGSDNDDISSNSALMQVMSTVEPRAWRMLLVYTAKNRA